MQPTKILVMALVVLGSTTATSATAYAAEASTPPMSAAQCAAAITKGGGDPSNVRVGYPISYDGVDFYVHPNTPGPQAAGDVCQQIANYEAKQTADDAKYDALQKQFKNLQVQLDAATGKKNPIWEAIKPLLEQEAVPITSILGLSLVGNVIQGFLLFAILWKRHRRDKFNRDHSSLFGRK